MPSTDSTSPVASDERAAIARLLEATRDHLTDERLDPNRTRQLVVWLAVGFDRAALAIRQGHRAGVVDRVTADLDRFMADLVGQ